MTLAFDPNRPATATNDLQVEYVRHPISGKVLESRRWFPTQAEGQLHALRPSLRQSGAAQPFTCFSCGHPVILKKHAHGGHYFAHKDKTAARQANCVFLEKSSLSLEDIDRLRYQGQREGPRHRQTKEWIRRIVAADARFSKPEVETIWRTFDDGWRKPDVATSWHGFPVVFEAQVSNTYPAIVAERTDFYRRQGALLIWIFDQLPDQHWRTLHADIFCANHQQLFLVDEACACAAEENGSAIFRSYRLRPEVVVDPASGDGYTCLTAAHVEEQGLVEFSQLQLDASAQTAKQFDVNDEQRRVMHKVLCSRVQASKTNWQELEVDIRNIIQRKASIPYATVMSWASLVCAIESARFWQPIGTRYSNPVSVLNLVHDSSPTFFAHLVHTLQRLHVDPTEHHGGAWPKRVADFHAGRYKGGSLPEPHEGSIALLAWLYPN
ncbi:DUF6035 family protein [Azonexus hydrophilus]|uniref:DUF6035 family protein n=1 Tax=Azonexus hydrophilus TaxID=418702 RepID=UPI0003FCA8D6|nr:DUF6035 family protein [Azonexus hydrophilus]